MSFTTAMLAFLLVMAVLVFAAVVVGVPQGWLAIGIAVGIGGLVAWALPHLRHLPPSRRR